MKFKKINTSKTIWLVNKHAAPIELYATHQRTVYLAKYLTELGYEVYVISNSYIHNRNINIINHNEKFIISNTDNIRFIYLKGLSYKGNNLIRVFSFIHFSLNLYFLKKQFKKPDFVIHTSNIPFDFLVYYTAKALNAKYIIEVLDLWPESFVTYGLIKRTNILLKVFYKIEKMLYKNANNIVFSMEGGIDYIKDKKWDTSNGGCVDLSKVRYISNGVDLCSFDENRVIWQIIDNDLLDKSTFKVIYMGSIRLTNNLKLLIDAAQMLRDNELIKFIIYGNGADRESMINFCKSNNMSNVIFKNKWVDPKYVPFILSSCSLNILNYTPNEIFKYGGSQNKLFQALASGKPICCNIGMKYSIINKYELGIDKKFDNPEDYSSAIYNFSKMRLDEYNEMCLRVRNAAKNYDYKKISMDYSEIL